MIPVQVIVDPSVTPESVLNRELDRFSRGGNASTCFALQYEYRQYYLPGNPSISLCALACCHGSAGKVTLRAAIVEASQPLCDALAAAECTEEGLDEVVTSFSAAWIDLSAPLLLEPIAIPKPWGQEIWYTGIEERGQSRVLGEGGSVPLPWLLSLAPKRLAGDREKQLTLLKILDPLPDEVYGDLYFEMHEEKREVYVVSHIDSAAWPSGVGGIRFGFDPEMVAQFDDEAAFKASYLAAVKAYESVRRRIDARLDEKRQSESLPLDAPVDAGTLRAWLTELPSDLIQEEKSKREQMEAYTALRPLTLGDVVSVPCFTPHSLQHGVRTVEFQTPVYERKILSFAQKVLTQSHWDTEEALSKMAVTPPGETALVILQQASGVTVEQVVDFDDFEVHRYTLTAGASVSLPLLPAFGLLMLVAGELQCQQSRLQPEMAALLGALFSGVTVVNGTNNTAIFLLALPKLPSPE